MRARVLSLAIRLVSALVLAAATAATVGSTAAARSRPEREPLVVHEWGTFTSVAGENGSAVRWLPQAGPNDLPCFVHRNPLQLKTSLYGTVRMETPVLYFYAAQPTSVEVRVGFPRGIITEWFPKADVTPGPTGSIAPGTEGAIDWRDVKLTPGAAPTLPTEAGPSHYYAARRTESTPLQLGSEREQFLFYRGVGDFPPPITAAIAGDGRFILSNIEKQPLGDLLIYQNRGGITTYRFFSAQSDQTMIDAPTPGGDPESLFDGLERRLVAAGLYQPEAAAMIDTWRDSWFEEGTRIIYIVPRPQVDAIVPLEISPRPIDVARVFVGRVELVTAEAMREVTGALLVNDRPTLEKYGRFLRPIGDRILSASANRDRGALERTLQSVYATSPVPGLASCLSNGSAANPTVAAPTSYSSGR